MHLRNAAACVLAALLAVTAAAQPKKATDREIAMVVTAMLDRGHLLRRKLDDNISERIFKKYFESLDPRKLYFVRADVDAVAPERRRLDDLLRRGDIQFAYDVHDRFVRRLEARVKLVHELLEAPLDFTRDEERILDPDLIDYPADGRETRDRWRRRLKYDLLVMKQDKIEEAKALERLRKRFDDFLEAVKKRDRAEVRALFINTVAECHDPHSAYFSPHALENFSISMRLNYQGIGALLGYEDGYPKVERLIPGGAAEKQGKLRNEDQIVAVGQGAKGEMVDVYNMKFTEVVKLVRGKEGTVVRLAVKPGGRGKSEIITIVRAKIELKDSEAKSKIHEVGKKADGSALKVGYVDLPSFYMDTAAAIRGDKNYRSSTRDVRRMLEDFTAKGVDGVVLDLRQNGGGSLEEAVALTGLFIDRGPVVQIRSASGRVSRRRDPEKGMAWDGPLVVLTSKFSASASEILAAAIKDYRRGIIVGDPATAGKGTVQHLIDLGDVLEESKITGLGGLKLTIQKFYRPTGRSTQKRGVAADIVLPSFTAHMEVGESVYPYALDYDEIDSAAFEPDGRLTKAAIEALRADSGTRCAASAEFKKFQDRIAEYRRIRDRKRISVNEKKYFAETEKLNGARDEAADAKKPDFYLSEVLQIARGQVMQRRT